MGGEHGGDITGPLQVKHPGDVEEGEAGVVQTKTGQETGQDLLQLQPACQIGSRPGIIVATRRNKMILTQQCEWGNVPKKQS